MTIDDEKRISLLTYAIMKSGSRDISIETLISSSKTRLYDNFYIEKFENNMFVVGFSERGKKNNHAIFYTLRDAIDYAYFNNLDYEKKIGLSIYKYREEWERETGLSF